MGDRQTIADSKRAFHQQFPYVISPLYRRMSDELLVELHLLSHQKQFKTNALFAVGLHTVFKAFTQGYRPESHTIALFDALCSSNGFDAESLRNQAQATLDEAKQHSDQDSEAWLSQFRLDDDSHYSRLMGIGVFSLLEASQSDAGNTQASDLKDDATGLAERLNISSARLEKDITLYLSSRERLEQAVELMEETLASDRRKREQRQAEATQGSSK